MPRPKRIFNEYGVSGLKRFGGTISEEYIADLRGEMGRKTLRRMAMTDSTIGAVLFIIKQLTKAANWETRPHPMDESKTSDKAVEFVDGVLNDMSSSWPSTISSICSMYEFGFDLREICYKQRLGRDAKYPSAYNDGRIGIRKLAVRSQCTITEWVFDKSGGVKGAWQEDPDSQKRIFLPIEKCLLFRTEEDNANPEGRSIIANAYIPWYFLRNYRELEGIGVEKDVTGTMIVKLAADMFTDSANATKLQEWKNLVSNYRNDELDGILLPHDPNNPDLFDVSLLASPGEKMYDIAKIIDRLKAEIAQVCLTDFILLGHEGVGSFALARSKQEALSIAVSCWLDLIASVINTHLIPKLMKLNPEFSGLEYYPEVVPTMAKVPSYEEISSLVRSLAFASFHVSSNQDILNSILDSYGLPKVGDEEFANLMENSVDGKIEPTAGLLEGHPSEIELANEIADEGAIEDDKMFEDDEPKTGPTGA